VVAPIILRGCDIKCLMFHTHPRESLCARTFISGSTTDAKTNHYTIKLKLELESKQTRRYRVRECGYNVRYYRLLSCTKLYKCRLFQFNSSFGAKGVGRTAFFKNACEILNLGCNAAQLANEYIKSVIRAISTQVMMIYDVPYPSGCFAKVQFCRPS
jgi:hypothetical protein